MVRSSSHTYRERMIKQMWPMLTIGKLFFKELLVNTSCNSLISWILFQNKKSKNLKLPMTMHLRITKSLQWPTRLYTIWLPVKSLTPPLLLHSCSLTPFHLPVSLLFLNKTKTFLSQNRYTSCALCLNTSTDINMGHSGLTTLLKIGTSLLSA